MEKLPTDVIFLLLYSCSPPDYVHLALALCRRLSVYPLRCQAMAQLKGDEWRQILLEQRIQRWREYFLSKRESERPARDERDAFLNTAWSAVYGDQMIDFYALLLGRAGLCPLKDDFPSQEKILDLLNQVDPTERERLKHIFLECLSKVRFN